MVVESKKRLPVVVVFKLLGGPVRHPSCSYIFPLQNILSIGSRK